MRCAAASVTDKACFLANIRSSPNVSPLPSARAEMVGFLYGVAILSRHPALVRKPARGGGQGVDGEIDLRRRRKPAEADADPCIGILIRQPKRPQHVGWLHAR